jgi:dUTP pyrophosphatase
MSNDDSSPFDRIQVRVKLLRPGARLPVRATPGATGLDLHACLESEDTVVTVGPDPVLVPTGIAVEIPEGYDLQVRPRSGLTRQGILVPLGTIDSDYRGEVLVAMHTVGARGPHLVRHGDRIAQMVLSAVVPMGLVEVQELSQTFRGGGGHGSTGT